jgi:uncharacterized membrane protein HdeD (DUF308 family)
MGVAALILVVSATIASVYTIAIFMILAGGAEIPTGLSAKTWGRFLLCIFAGLAYIVVAAFALAQPLVAAAFFTLVLGSGMIATGIVRIYLGCISVLRCAALFCLLRAYGACWIVDRCGLAGEQFRDLGRSPWPRSLVLGRGLDKVWVALARF